MIEKTKKNHEILLLWIVLAAVTFLFLAFFLRQSIRFDEAETLWASSKSIPFVLQFSAQNFESPLYLLLLYFWQMLFGVGIVAGRILSFLFFLCAIACMYYLGKIAYDKKLGAFAALLFAASPFMNWYGAEARMYSLFALLAVLNQYFFIKILQYQTTANHTPPTTTGSIKNIWFGYVITAILGVYTHYFFFFALLAQIVFVMVFHQRFSKNAMGRIFLTTAIALVLFIPWLLYMIQVGDVTAILAKQNPTSVTIFNTFSNFLFGFNNDHLNTIIISFWPLTVLLGFLSLRRNKTSNIVNFFFLFSILMPIFGMFLVSFIQPLFLSRYLILTLPTLYLFLGSILFSYPGKLGSWIRILLIVITFSFLVSEATSAAVPVKENYQGASMYLEENAGANDVIALSTPYTIFPFEYYYHGPATLITIPAWNTAKDTAPKSFSLSELESEANLLKKTYGRLWLLLSQDEGYQSQLKMYFDTHFEKLYDNNFSDNLNLYMYKLNYKQ